MAIGNIYISSSITKIIQSNLLLQVYGKNPTIPGRMSLQLLLK